MGKKTLPSNRKAITHPAVNRPKRNLRQKNQKQTSLDEEKSSNDTCSICLNQIKKPSLCSGCLHLFCFSCITKWSTISSTNNCPVCRKEYRNILHNFDRTVKIIKLNEDNSKENHDPFYVIEADDKQMVGMPIMNNNQVTNNIVQLNARSLHNIPEIDIINMTKNDDGGRIITRHNYQLSCSEQTLINELITSAIGRSVEEHKETIDKVKDAQSNSVFSRNENLSRLIDLYTFDRTRKRRIRNRNNFGFQSRYNLRQNVRANRTNNVLNGSI